MAKLLLDKLSKRFDQTQVLSPLNLAVEEKEFLVLVGPSGCGKSTLLRLIAGLEEPSSGTIEIENRVVNDVQPKDRDIAMVFQNYALYPHMSVYDNMAFGLKMRKVPKEKRDRLVRQAAERLELTELLKRKPKQLSGGQRQRVALGRAIVRKPKIFLMDEPLSNLDARLRQQMRHELATLHKSLEATTIYVTHDQVEALTLGDRIVVLNKGKIQQLDTPTQIYEKPANLFVAGFIGQMNFLPAQVRGQHLELAASQDPWPIPAFLQEKLQDGAPLTIGFRPEKATCSPQLENLPSSGFHFSCAPNRFELLGAEKNGYFQWDKQGQEKELIVRMPAETPLSIGQQAWIHLPEDALHWFDSATEERLA